MSVFAAIADPVRRGILRILVDGPHRVIDIQQVLADRHPISRPAVSKHLRVLADAGLVEATETGRERHYRLEPAPLGEVQEFMADLGLEEGPQRIHPLIGESALDALDTEIYRTRRERRSAATPDGVANRDGAVDEHPPATNTRPHTA